MIKSLLTTAALAATTGLLPTLALAGHDHDNDDGPGRKLVTQLGPRPYFLVEDMTDSPLKRELQACASREKRFEPTQFSIGHRGAALQFPEHTVESYTAGARMGAGILECDVTFTKDKELCPSGKSA